MPPPTRILAQLNSRSVVYIRSPDGNLSRVKLRYASGKRLTTHAGRSFGRRDGIELAPPPGEPPATLHPRNELTDAEYEAQLARSTAR